MAASVYSKMCFQDCIFLELLQRETQVWSPIYRKTAGETRKRPMKMGSMWGFCRDRNGLLLLFVCVCKAQRPNLFLTGLGEMLKSHWDKAALWQFFFMDIKMWHPLFHPKSILLIRLGLICLVWFWFHLIGLICIELVCLVCFVWFGLFGLGWFGVVWWIEPRALSILRSRSFSWSLVQLSMKLNTWGPRC